MTNRPMELRCSVGKDERTEGQEKKKLTVAFRSFANVPKKGLARAGYICVL